MAVELEQTVMQEIGLGQHYTSFNGSSSCAGIARSAVEKLREVADNHELVISEKWLSRLQEALSFDTFNGRQDTMTNTWICCSYAIQDAIHRSDGGDGYGPSDNYELTFCG